MKHTLSICLNTFFPSFEERGKKKGQLFFFAAVVLLALAFGTISTYKEVELTSSFSDLVENYMQESPVAANHDAFLAFTNLFVSYARTRDPLFGVVAVHAGDVLTVVNALGQPIIINNQHTLEDNRSMTLNVTKTVDVVFGTYAFNIPVQNRTVSALFASLHADATHFRVKVS